MEREERSPSRFTEQNLLNTSVGHDESSLVIPSEPDNVVPAQPAKRPTRQWAAWTREEEECFFNALRQVGKNFEKITCRVESKNKDQVRHYYYRLVRRMNKWLGPSLCLDAKNSKDTNAAMLRWWSLLEKYSCKASKLHLKPRRFKIFVEALEHQLLKDRKKNIKKRSSQGEPCSSSTSTSPNQNKSSGNESRAVKLVAIDGQNAQKAGHAKGSSARRNSNLGVARNTNKGDSSPIKSTRQRRKTGVVSAAAIKRWEKAAIDGVSLVADAAEHVERTAGVKQADFLDGLTVLSVQAVGCSMEQNDPGPSGDVHSNSLIKLKLQLFPIDDNTRRALEMDKHNPHLELTLSTRKKISSVLEHIGRKWGNSSVASGELMLFPFNTQRENLVSYNRWTRDSAATATEVYAMIGSPPVFRLRYGWIVSTELQSAIRKAPAALPSNRLVDDTDGNNALVDSFPLQAKKKDESEKHDSYNSGDQPTQNGCATAVSREGNITNANVSNDVTEPTNFTSILKRNGSCDGSTSKKLKNMVDYRLRKSPTLSAGEWADSLTNVSVGDLLPDAPNTIVASCVESPALESSRCVEQVPFTCDSFDAAIAAHILKQNKLGYSVPSPHLSSIWDAEETCDEFSFRKRATERRQHPYPATPATSFAGDRCANSSEDINDVQDAREAITEDVREEDRMDECPSEPREVQNISRDFSSLTDIYWPDSLGPLELDVPSCKYYSEDLILSDSLSGLNRFIANSLDAFQHCSLFSLDDKRPSPAADVQGGASFAGKICTGDSSGVQPLQV